MPGIKNRCDTHKATFVTPAKILSCYHPFIRVILTRGRNPVRIMYGRITHLPVRIKRSNLQKKRFREKALFHYNLSWFRVL